jgi:hypothetical protein
MPGSQPLGTGRCELLESDFALGAADDGDRDLAAAFLFHERAELSCRAFELLQVIGAGSAVPAPSDRLERVSG